MRFRRGLCPISSGQETRGDSGERKEETDPGRDVAGRLLEGAPFRRVVALYLRRILDTPVDPLCVARKDRAARGCPVADGDHVIELLADEPVEGLRVLPFHVQAEEVRYRRPCHRVNFRTRLTAGADGIRSAARHMPKKRFGYLRPGGVSGAQKEDPHRAFPFHGLAAQQQAAAVLVSVFSPPAAV